MAFTSREWRSAHTSTANESFPSTAVVRKAKREDLPFIKELSLVFSPFGPYNKIIPRWFRDPLIKTFVVEKEGRRSGFFMLGLWIPSWLSRRVELMAIAVVPEERRQGLGSLMLREAQELVFSRGYRILRAHVGCENLPALKLFQKFSFKIRRRLEGYYPSGLPAFELIKRGG